MHIEYKLNWSWSCCALMTTWMNLIGLFIPTCLTDCVFEKSRHKYSTVCRNSPLARLSQCCQLVDWQGRIHRWMIELRYRYQVLTVESERPTPSSAMHDARSYQLLAAGQECEVSRSRTNWTTKRRVHVGITKPRLPAFRPTYSTVVLVPVYHRQ
jgi:hypothetical protein